MSTLPAEPSPRPADKISFTSPELGGAPPIPRYQEGESRKLSSWRLVCNISDIRSNLDYPETPCPITGKKYFYCHMLKKIYYQYIEFEVFTLRYRCLGANSLKTEALRRHVRCVAPAPSKGLLSPRSLPCRVWTDYWWGQNKMKMYDSFSFCTKGEH